MHFPQVFRPLRVFLKTTKPLPFSSLFYLPYLPLYAILKLLRPSIALITSGTYRPMEKHFTHLHVHTDYSLLDGAITLDKLMALARSKTSRRLLSPIMVISLEQLNSFKQAKKLE